MIGRVIEGRYAGGSVHSLPERNITYIQTPEGNKIAISKKNALSMEDVTQLYPSCGKKVKLVMWNDFETSIIALGNVSAPHDPPAQPQAVAYVQEQPYPQEPYDQSCPQQETCAQSQLPQKTKRKKPVLILCIVSILLLLGGTAAFLLLTNVICLSHEWMDATCKAPMTCTKCEETQGSRLKHEWEEATCENPKTCSLCGDTKGEALTHQWKAASCEEPQTCSVCKATEGSALGHKPGNWELKSEPKDGSSGIKVRSCETCHAEVDLQEFYYPYFNMSFEEFLNKHNSAYASYGWQIREVSTGFSYFMNGKETAIIFHRNLNNVISGTATAYSTRKLEEFNELTVRLIDHGASLVDYDDLTSTLMVGAVITQPLGNYELDTFIDNFMDNWVVTQSSDTSFSAYAVFGTRKYILEAYRSVTGSYSNVFYEWTCQAY